MTDITVVFLIFQNFTFYFFMKGSKVDRNEIISGQIFLRDSGKTPPSDKSKRKLMMVTGIIAVPENFNLKGECKYTIAGKKNSSGIAGLFQMIDPEFGKASPEFDEINITIFPDTEEDLSDSSLGQTLSGLLLQPIWRI